MSSRGIVTGLRTDGNSLHGAVNLQDLLKWILYWDKITYAGVTIPGGSTISGNHPADVSFLEQEGIFQTVMVDLTSLQLPTLPEPEPGMKVFGLAGNQFHIVNSAARIHLSNELSNNDEFWTIGQSGGESLLLPGTVPTELIDVQLFDSLPVPVEGTPFADILEFKLRYSSELDALRFYLDELRERILSSTDERRAIDATLNNLSNSISNLTSALSSRKIEAYSETVSLYTCNPSFGFWSAIGAAAAGSSGLPVEIGISSGGAASTMFKFLKRMINGGDNLPNTNTDFSYVQHISENFKTK